MDKCFGKEKTVVFLLWLVLSLIINVVAIAVFFTAYLNDDSVVVTINDYREKHVEAVILIAYIFLSCYCLRELVLRK